MKITYQMKNKNTVRMIFAPLLSKHNMGSIEVYDHTQQKWVPYIDDSEKWYQHFKDLRDGYVTPDHRGRYIIGSGNSRRRLVTLETKLKETEKKLKETEEKLQNAQRPVVNMVSPVAQAVEMAKSEVKRLRDSNIETSAPKKRKTDIDWTRFTF